MSFVNRIRVRVLHHDPILHAGLETALSAYPDLDVLARGDVRSTPLAPFHVADVALTDHAFGMQIATRTERGLAPLASRQVIVAATNREWEIKEALERGVQGYLLMDSSLDAIVDGIRAVHAGQRCIDARVAAQLAESLAIDALTGREEEVLRLVLAGLCNKVIGRRLGIAVGTVKSHLRSTFEKLNVTSRTQAIIAVQRRGLLREEEPVDACSRVDAPDGHRKIVSDAHRAPAPAVALPA